MRRVSLCYSIVGMLEVEDVGTVFASRAGAPRPWERPVPGRERLMIRSTSMTILTHRRREPLLERRRTRSLLCDSVQ